MGRQRPTPNNPVMYRLFARSCFERRKAGFHRRWRNSHLAPSELPLSRGSIYLQKSFPRSIRILCSPLFRDIVRPMCNPCILGKTCFSSRFSRFDRANRWNLLVVNSNSAASLIIIYFEWTRFNPVIYLGHKLTRLTITVTPG